MNSTNNYTTEVVCYKTVTRYFLKVKQVTIMSIFRMINVTKIFRIITVLRLT